MKTHNMPKIVICGNYGAMNLGDEAVLDGIIFLIKKSFPQVDITVLSHNSNNTTATHNVISLPLIPTGIRSFIRGISNRTIWKTVKIIKNCDIFILGGGTLFSEKKPFSIFLWGLHLKIAQLFKRKTFIYANGIGRIKRPLPTKIVKELLSKTTAITVRDQESLNQLKKLNIKKRAILSSDPAFLIEKYLKPKSQKENSKYVVFNCRNLPEINTEKINILAKFIDHIINETKFKIYFVSFQEYREKDTIILNKIFNLVKNKNDVHIMKNIHNYHQAYQLIKNAEITIGTRLHSIIFSIVAGTPFISLGYDDKVINLLKHVGLNKYCIQISDLKYSKLKKLLTFVIKQNNQIKQKLMNTKIEQIKKSKFNSLILGKILNNENTQEDFRS